MLRCERPRPRYLHLAPGEREYLRRQWPLLTSLTRALRTEPNVALAVLFGSQARGDDGAHSDVDLLVAFRRHEVGAGAQLALRLELALGVSVDVASLDHVRETSPQLLEHALRDGRVILDRDGLWKSLCAKRTSIRSAATRARRRAQEEAADAFAVLTAA